MLTITFVNVSGPGVEICDYEVRVFVNGKLIHSERVLRHPRASGWRELLDTFVHQSTPSADR